MATALSARTPASSRSRWCRVRSLRELAPSRCARPSASLSASGDGPALAPGKPANGSSITANASSLGRRSLATAMNHSGSSDASRIDVSTLTSGSPFGANSATV